MFQTLLQKAEQLGLYDPSQEIIENYCKVKKRNKKYFKTQSK
mgnify:CR=1 FL=1